MDRLYRFYGDVLGLDLAGGDPEHGFVELDAGGTSICPLAGREGAVGEAAPKLVFGVDDLDAAADYLRDHGVTLGDPRNPAPGVHVVDARDPEGNAFSIETTAD